MRQSEGPFFEPAPVPVRLATLAALLSGISIMVMGNGLQSTLIAVRANLEGFGADLTGLIQSAYFAGFALGSYLAARVIQHAGHVNSFAAFASIASIATLSHAVWIDPWFWVAMRALNGACYAGLVVVTESWLNASAVRETRGRVLAIYLILAFAAGSAGQVLLTLADPASFELFVLASVLISGSLVPLVLSRARVPAEMPRLKLRLVRVYRVSPFASATAFGIGVVSSGFFGLGALFAQRQGFSDGSIALFMVATMLGGLALQWPVGYVSDRVDRRWLLIVVALGAAGSAAALALAAATGAQTVLFVLAFAYGGLMIPIYSLAIAIANDRIEAEELVTVSAGLTMLYAIGSLAGPLIGGVLIRWVGPWALYAYMAAGLIAIALFGLWRLTRRESVPRQDYGPFVAVTRTTPMSSALDPRWPGEVRGVEPPRETDKTSPDTKSDDGRPQE
jgi:MFS family permease